MPTNETLLIIILALIGLSALLQAVSLLVMAIVAGKAVKSVREYAEEFRGVGMPVLQHSKDLLQTTKQLIERLEPRLDSAAHDMAEMARMASEETRKIQVSADEITERIRRQAERMETMTTSALNGVDRMGHFLNEAVTVPVRQVSGVVAAAKAIVDTLRSPAPARRRVNQDRPAKSETGQFV